MAESMILCVDDESFVLDSIFLQLTRHFARYRIELCSAGGEALEVIRDELARGNFIPLIISDYLMPGMKGDEFLQAAHSLTPQTNNVILTGQATLGGVINAINNARVFRYLAKPWEENDLVVTVERAIESFEQQRKIRDLAKKREQLYQEMREGYISSIYAFASAIDAKDSYTIGHSRRVAQLGVAVAREMGFDERQLERIEHMGILHDVGKIGIPDGILLKKDKLTCDEYEVMKQHVNIGVDILSEMSTLGLMLPGILYHHEAVDGSGYLGLSGEDIPLEARILSLADAYDAMTSDRPYRAAMSHGAAIAEIERNMGTQFDERAAGILIRILREQGEPGEVG